MKASQSPCFVSSPSLMTSNPTSRCRATTHPTAARSAFSSSVARASNPGGPGRLPTCVVRILGMPPILWHRAEVSRQSRSERELVDEAGDEPVELLGLLHHEEVAGAGHLRLLE